MITKEGQIALSKKVTGPFFLEVRQFEWFIQWCKPGSIKIQKEKKYGKKS